VTEDHGDEFLGCKDEVVHLETDALASIVVDGCEWIMAVCKSLLRREREMG
jgi:hypothetical protein